MDQGISDLPRYGINVRDHGARGDGATDDAPAIQAALDAGHELVVVPYGIYRIGRGLRVRSRTRLLVHPQARLVLADGAGVDIDSFLLSNADPVAGDSSIHVEGGIWDGNNRGNPRGAERDPRGYTGVLMNFLRVEGLVLRGLTLVDPSSYFTRLSAVRRFRVEGIHFLVRHLGRNQDGLHLAGFCEDGDIRDLVATGLHATGDDLLAINADDAMARSETRGGLAGPIRRIRARGLRADDCHSFIRFASVWSAIEDVTIDDVAGGCSVNAVNADGLRHCRVPLFRSDDPAYALGAGLLRRIRLSRFRVHKTAPGQHALFRLQERMEDFAIEDFQRDLTRDAAPQCPALWVAWVETGDGVVEGLTDAEARACEAGSRLRAVRHVALPDRGIGPRNRRLEFAVAAAGEFACPAERFARFAMATSRIEPLPPPNWDVGLPG